MECVLCYYSCSTTPDWKRDLLPPLSVFHPLSPSVPLRPSLLLLYHTLPIVSSFTSFPPPCALRVCYSPPPHPSLPYTVDPISYLLHRHLPPLAKKKTRVVETPYKGSGCWEQSVLKKRQIKDFEFTYVNWTKGIQYPQYSYWNSKEKNRSRQKNNRSGQFSVYGGQYPTKAVQRERERDSLAMRSLC